MHTWLLGFILSAAPGVHHAVADRFAAALEAGDAHAAAATFADDGVLTRALGPDVRGPAGAEPVFKQAFGYCHVHVTHVLERANAFVLTTTSQCKHPKFERDQSHLFQVELAGDRIAKVAVLTEVMAPPQATLPQRRDELEDPSTLTAERAALATCDVDHYVELGLQDFRGTTHTTWATPTCTVATVQLPPPGHGYVDVECEPRSRSCQRAPSAKRYLDWNTYRLAPFAAPAAVYVEKTR